MVRVQGREKRMVKREAQAIAQQVSNESDTPTLEPKLA
jgi:hypothetical protein